MKVAVITGAASGIGAGLAKQAVARGMKVGASQNLLTSAPDATSG